MDTPGGARVLFVDDDPALRELLTDYLAKPFSPRQLLARLHALLRRRIDPDAAHPAYIRTVRGEGNLFDPNAEAR